MSKENIQACAWQAVGGSIWGHKTSDDDRALYDQDALDAAVAAERERCAQYLRDAAERMAPGVIWFDSDASGCPLRA